MAGRERKRLLYVCNNPGFFASYRATAASAALAAGYDVHVATPAGDGVRQIEARGLMHHHIPLIRRSMNPVRELRTIRALRRLYSKLCPDVVEHMTIKPVLYGSIAARGVCPDAVINWLAGLGFLFTDRGPMSRTLQSAVLGIYRIALDVPGSTVVFENGDHRDAFVHTATVPLERAYVIEGAGVTMDTFVPSPLPQAPPVVMFAGRMIWDKGVREFVAAAELVRARGGTARFVLVGAPDPGNPSSIDERQLAAWNAAGAVEWCGERQDMAEVYKSCSVFCFPTAYAEGVPRVLIEAAASCRPIVTTDVPGCREVVRHGENGLLVRTRSAAAVAEAIETLVADPRRCEQMGRRGRELVINRFSVATVVGATLDLYGAVADRRTGVRHVTRGSATG